MYNSFLRVCLPLDLRTSHAVSDVESFKYVFEYTAHFNQDLSAWNVHDGSDFKSMFEYATAFDQKLCWALPENSITDRMFDGCKGSLSADC